MRFSVIIPTYNEQEYIEGCLQSVLSQHYNNSQVEIIVSDAQSSDKTVQLAHHYTSTVLMTTTRGIAHGRNLGAEKAKGDILVFVDADVKLTADFLSQLDDSFRQQSVVAVTGRAIPMDGNMFARFVYRATYFLVELFNSFGVALFPGTCVAYRAEAFRKMGGFREDFGITEDLDLSKRISQYGACRVNNLALAFVSTRRLEKHAFSTVLFHIYHDLRYLLFGTSARVYPKSEEVHSAADLWRLNRRSSEK